MRFLRGLLASVALVATASVPCLAQSGSFGIDVVVGQDELIIAEPNNFFRPGTVYVYRRSGASWQPAEQLRAAEADRADGFGTVLAVAGAELFVGQRAGPLHVFRREDGSWRPAGTLDAEGVGGVEPGCNQYGYCGTDFGIALAAEGDWLLVGEPGPAAEDGEDGEGSQRRRREAPPQLQPGVVHTFQRGADGAWTARGALVPGDPEAGDRFGAALAFAGGRALVGAPGRSEVVAGAPVERSGRVYEFVLDGGAWREAGFLESSGERNAGFGAALAMDGEVAVVGAPGSGDGHGAAYLYRRDASGGGWIQESRLAAFSSVRGDRFGSAVAVDGHDVWIGAPAPRGTATGMVYAYRGREGEVLPEEARRIRLTETVTRDAFGDRIFAEGGLVAVVATGMHHQAGAVFIYERDEAGEWRDRGMLASPPDALAELVGEERRCTDGRVGPFECEDVELLAFVPNSLLRAPEQARGVRTNDNWGWTDPETGREYALVGRNDGTSFVDITDPSNPVLVGDLPKTPDTPPSQLWRDMKTYKDHVFVVADGAGNHGMQVFDLRRLREVRDPPALFEPDAHYDLVASVHNIAINEESGFAYLVGARAGGETCGGGLHMVDIRDPLNPTFAGCFLDERGTHDVQCVVYQGPDQRYRGRELCLKANGSFLSISDVTDKANPVLVSRGHYPDPGYLHQGWLTEDHRYFYMDDEADVLQGKAETTRTLIWDLSDVEDPVLARLFMGSMPASAHNLYVKDGFAYQANYRYGLHVLDISDPVNPREVGHFNTAPHISGPGFSGAWSTYPFFESGTVIVTSLQEGLFVLKKRDPVF